MNHYFTELINKSYGLINSYLYRIVIRRMSIRFINRQKELHFLNSRYANNAFELIIIHGRRRVGKSLLILKFIENKNSVYIQMDQSSEKNVLELLSTETSRQLVGSRLSFLNLEEYFEFLSKYQEERLVLVIDEFQYLVQAYRGIASILQRWVDTRWKHGKLFIILCGSEIRMMEELFAYNNPLYGRRTGQWKVLPFSIPSVVEFFPDLDISQIILILSVFGNIPAYLYYYNSKLSIFENIANTMLSEGHNLSEEPLFILQQEFREINRYFSILKAVSLGKTRLVDISNDTGIEARTLPKYLLNLISINLLKKIYPIGMRKATSKYVRYHLNDQYMRFWFKFINPNINMLRMDGTSQVLQKISNELPDYMGVSFEIFCLELLQLLNTKNLLPNQYTEMGKWWKKGIELDIVGISDHSILCCEVKYGSKVNGKQEFNHLLKMIPNTPFRKKKLFCIIIARDFNLKNQNCITVDKLWHNFKENKNIKIEPTILSL